MMSNTAELTGALCAYRDSLRNQAKEVMRQPEELLRSAKDIHHAAKIQSNKLNKDADAVQQLITTSMQAELDSAKSVQNDYGYKTRQAFQREQIALAELFHKDHVSDD